jgi:hypothetical protein
MAAYSTFMNGSVQGARAWLAKYGEAEREELQAFRRAGRMLTAVLVAEAFVFFGVMLWGAYRPISGAGDNAWAFNGVAVVMAIFTALIAPIATFCSTPLRDDQKKLRSTAVLATLGMLGVWAPAAFELMGASGLVGSIMRVFTIEDDLRPWVAVPVFVLGLFLVMVFNFVFRAAYDRRQTARTRLVSIDRFKTFDFTASQLEMIEVREAGIDKALDVHDDMVSKLDAQARKSLLDGSFKMGLHTKRAALKQHAPHHHAGYRVLKAHADELATVEALLADKPTTISQDTANTTKGNEP